MVSGEIPELRVAVLGAGRIGRLHGELLRHHVPGAELVAVADAVPDAVAAACEAFDVPSRSVEELLDDEGVEAIAICTPTDTHAELAIAALRRGKAVFCEKPVSLDVRAVDEVLAAQQDEHGFLMVGFNRRFDPTHAAVKRAIAAGRVGALRLVRITSRDPEPPPLDYLDRSGGLFLDMTIHDLDMSRHLVGAEVVAVTAVGAVRVDPAIGELGDIDTAVLTLEHADGCLTVIDNSRQCAFGYDQRIEAFGEAGMVVSDNVRVDSSMVVGADGAVLSGHPYFFLDRYRQAYLNEWRAFVHAVRHGEPSPIDGYDGRAPVVIGLAAQRSLQERRTVQVDEVENELTAT